MRWDSPIVLVAAGTVAIHTLLVVFVDAIVVTHPIVLPAPAPVIEMVEVEVQPPKPPEPPEPPKLDLPSEPQEPVVTRPVQPRAARTQSQVRSRPEPPPETPPVPGPPGGDDPPTIKLDDPVPGGKGILPPPSKGTRGTGRGGSGGGTGGGTGSGDGTPPAPPPVSVATIKNPAMPKGDYGYIDAGKDYPAAARQLGIEGKIRVKLVVDATGKVRSALLLDTLGYGLDELALTRSKLIQFEPAKDTNDKAVASVVVWTFNMALPK